MDQSISVKEAERKALRLALYQDGLWDIFMGCMLLMMSLYPIIRAAIGPLPNLLVLLATLAALAVGFDLVKRRVIMPRIGLVRLGKPQKARIKALNVLALILVIATFALYALAAMSNEAAPASAPASTWLQNLDVDLAFSVLIVALFALAAYVLNVPRLHLYGWLFGVGNFASTVLDVYYGHRFHAPMAIAGAIVLTIGVKMFGRFLRDYPVPSELEGV